MILSALELLMKNDFFCFGDTHWRQIDGTAMGAPPAPACATLYFAVHEVTLLKQFGKHLLFYGRFIDDAVGIWTAPSDPLEDAAQWASFQQKLNSFGSLSWEVSHRSDSVDFMDLNISISTGRITAKIFEKSQNLYLYLPPTSCHTPGILRGAVIGMIHRCHCLTTHKQDFIHQVELLFHRFVA